MSTVNPNALAERLTAGWIEYLGRRTGGRAPAPRALDRQESTAFDMLVALYIVSLQLPATGQRPSGTAPLRRGHQLDGVISTLDEQMAMYEDESLHELSLEAIPVDQLYEKATALQDSADRLPGWEDALAEVLVKWFKSDYFKWADPIKCPDCGGKTRHATMGVPSEEEKKGGAGRVELHSCDEGTTCEGVFRFPRFNDPRFLMKARIGRCGEWANLFCLFVRAVGLRARYVWNAEDHVWNEYFSPAQRRWIHLDSCEGARDQPLLYDKGWGKKMSYILAFSTDGAQDVTRGYVQDWSDTQKRRTKGPEEELAKILKEVTRRRRLGRSADDAQRLELEDVTEGEWLTRSREGEAEPQVGGEGRQSGTKEWKESRGEDGSQS